MSDQPELGGKVSLDTTDFKTQIAAVNREIRVIESGFRASAAALGDWSKDASGLEMRMSALTQEIGLQQAKVAALRGEYDRVAAEKGENSKAAQELQIKLNKETETLGKMQSELNGTQTALDGMGSEAQDTSKQVDKLGDESEDTSKKTGALSKMLVVDLVSAAELAGKAVIGIVNGLVDLGKSFVGAVTGAADLAGELVDASTKTGLSVTKLQELDYVAGQLGTDVDTVTGSMARMVRGVGDAIQGTGTAKDAFKSLGIELKDSNGELRSSEDIFNDTIQALGAVGNETERDALAMEIFGRSAQELNPLIKAGADEISRLTEEAHNVGAVIGEDNVYALESFGDQLASLKASFTGVVAQLASAVLPAFQSLTTWAQEQLPIVVAWLQENLPIAIQTLSDFWTSTLLPAIQVVWDWMQGSLIPVLRQIFTWLAKILPPAIAALSAFWTNTLLPAIQTVWKWISGTLLPVLLQLGGYLVQVVGGAISALSTLWTGTLQPALTTVWNFIKTNILPILATLGQIMGITLKIAITALAGLWQNVLKPALETVWSFITKYVAPALDNLNTKVIQPLTRSLQDGLDRALKAINKALEFFRDLLRQIKLPAWLTPGSPTPFEIGLWGIVDAMKEINRMGDLGFSNIADRSGGRPNAGGVSLGGIQIAIYGGGDPALVTQAAETGVLRAMRAVGAR